MAPRRTLSDSPFDTLQKTFDLLVAGPNPLAFDGTEIDGLPDRAIPLDELMAMLLHPSTQYEVRDAVVNALVATAKRDHESATIGLAGVLLPGLRCAAYPMATAFPDQAEDIEAEMLVCFLKAVAEVELPRARIAARLTWLAHNGASRLIRREVAEHAGPGNDPVSSAPRRPWGHPDLVLGRAVRAGVISARDAELIGTTRIGDVDLGELATTQGISYRALRQRRLRAENVLTEWLMGDEYLQFDVVAKVASTPCSSVGDRPRRVRSMDRRPEMRRSTPT
jgi:hypothetical protein